MDVESVGTVKRIVVTLDPTDLQALVNKGKLLVMNTNSYGTTYLYEFCVEDVQTIGQ